MQNTQIDEFLNINVKTPGGFIREGEQFEDVLRLFRQMECDQQQHDLLSQVMESQKIRPTRRGH